MTSMRRECAIEAKIKEILPTGYDHTNFRNSCYQDLDVTEFAYKGHIYLVVGNTPIHAEHCPCKTL